MKKALLIITALFVMSLNQVCALDLNKVTDSAKILSALKLLESVQANDVFANLEKTKSQIIFYDLSLMDFTYANHFAAASTDDYGRNYILINSKYQNAPKEALACLIAHESMHTLPQATLAEETLATTTEAKYWAKLKTSQSTALPNDKLVQRLNKLEALYVASGPGHNLISQNISGNSFYKAQLAN